MEPLTCRHLLAHRLFSSLLPALKRLDGPCCFHLCEFPIGSAPAQNHSVSLTVITGCSVCCGALPGLASVSLRKHKQRCCNSTWGDGQDFESVTNSDKGRKWCSFPHKTGSCGRTGFLTIQIQDVRCGV